MQKSTMNTNDDPGESAPKGSSIPWGSLSFLQPHGFPLIIPLPTKPYKEFITWLYKENITKPEKEPCLNRFTLSARWKEAQKQKREEEFCEQQSAAVGKAV